MTRPIKPHTGETSFKPGHSGYVGEQNGIWAGDKVKYSALHDWVSRHKGKPRLCEECGTTEAKKYEWANISGLYRRELEDWKRLCVSCHRKADGHALKGWATRRAKNA